MPNLGPVLLAGVALLGAWRWREAVWGALALAVFEGAIRKWILPQAQEYVYLLKDALLLGAYVAYFGGRLLRGRRLVPPHPANVPLMLVGVLCLVELANPALPSLTVGLFGIKAYLMFVPLMYLVPAALPEQRAARRFVGLLVLVALAPIALGSVQFYAPQDSPINQYVSDGSSPSRAAVFGAAHQVRVTATFSFMNGYVAYLLLVLLFGLALAVGTRRVRTRLALCGLLALAGVSLLMTGSRGPFLLLLGACPLLLLLLVGAGRQPVRRLAPLFMVALPASAFLVQGVFPEVGSAFLHRATLDDDLEGRLAQAITGPLRAAGTGSVLGFGVGSAHPALSYLLPFGGTAVPAVEGEWERIVVEIGPLGLCLVVLARVLVAAQLWRALRRGERDMRPLLAAALVYCLILLPGDVVYTHTTAVFYWFAAGLGLVPARLPSARAAPPVRPSTGPHVRRERASRP